MSERHGETLPPGWGALTVLRPSRRRRSWQGPVVVALALAAVAAWAIYVR